jgi:tetratricopeptide (TPR) repeat protein
MSTANSFAVTDGEIAAINAESARVASWAAFRRGPERLDMAEAILEHERIALYFFDEAHAFDRLDALVAQLEQFNTGVPASGLIAAQVASIGHRFRHAEERLVQAESAGASRDAVAALRLAIDQATGQHRGEVLAARRRAVADTASLTDLVALGALLAEFGDGRAADETYRRALASYTGVSPFPPAWACFHLGVLWGELHPQPDPERAARWYERAIDLLPGYVRARVHLAEITIAAGRLPDAESALLPAVGAGAADAHACFAEILKRTGREREAAAHLRWAHRRFDELLSTQKLAFADHAAAFYGGIGNDLPRALELALTNVDNRPTIEALRQSCAIAQSAGAGEIAADLALRLASTRREIEELIRVH